MPLLYSYMFVCTCNRFYYLNWVFFVSLYFELIHFLFVLARMSVEEGVCTTYHSISQTNPFSSSQFNFGLIDFLSGIFHSRKSFSFTFFLTTSMTSKNDGLPRHCMLLDTAMYSVGKIPLPSLWLSSCKCTTLKGCTQQVKSLPTLWLSSCKCTTPLKDALSR